MIFYDLKKFILVSTPSRKTKDLKLHSINETIMISTYKRDQ